MFPRGTAGSDSTYSASRHGMERAASTAASAVSTAVKPRDEKSAAMDFDGTVALELEHSLGFSLHPQGLAVYPDSAKDTILYGTGKLLIVSDLHEVHAQKVLRAHDAPITAVDVSRTGDWIVSGQSQAVDSYVYFILWNARTNEVKHRVTTPHKGHIDALRFSPDDGMIATTGVEGSLCLWDATTGKRVASYQDTINGDRCISVCWGDVTNPGTRNQRYSVYAAFNTGVRLCYLSFSVKTLTFELECKPCVMPGAGGRMGGYVRKYLCCTVLADNLVCGTGSGDLVVFSASTGNYRTALSLSANGVTAAVACPSLNCVLAGGGDGTVKKVTGSAAEWVLAAQIQLEGAVVSMSGSSDEKQVIAMTSAGLIYRIVTEDLTHTIASESPLGGITDLTTASTRPELFITTSRDGVLRVWDLVSYDVLSSFSLQGRGPKGTAGPAPEVPLATSAAVDESRGPSSALRLVTGWSDGRLRGVVSDARHGALEWSTPVGHKGSIHTVRVCDKYILSAGEDSCLRVWSTSTHELIAQMQEHKAAATAAHIDSTTNCLVHSAALDMTLFSYDLTKVDQSVNVRAPKRVSTHAESTCGGFLCISQRRDRERELIVGTVEGRVLFFDMDYPDPVMVLVDATRAKVASLAVSPDGRFLVAGLGDGSLTVYALDPHDSCKAKLMLHSVCHSSSVVRVVWTADGRQVLSAGSDGEVAIWNFYSATAGELVG